MALLLGFSLTAFLGLEAKSIGSNGPRCTGRQQPAGGVFKANSWGSRFQTKKKPASRGGRSGRAAHIGFAAADHALRRGLGVRLGGGRAGAIFELGHHSRFAPSKPRL